MHNKHGNDARHWNLTRDALIVTKNKVTDSSDSRLEKKQKTSHCNSNWLCLNQRTAAARSRTQDLHRGTLCLSWHFPLMCCLQLTRSALDTFRVWITNTDERRKEARAQPQEQKSKGRRNPGKHHQQYSIVIHIKINDSHEYCTSMHFGMDQ